MKKNAMAEVNNYLWRREERSRDTRFTEQYFLDHQNRTFGTEVFRKIMGIEDLECRYIDCDSGQVLESNRVR